MFARKVAHAMLKHPANALRRLGLALAAIAVLAAPAAADQNTLVTPGSPLTMTGLATFLNNAAKTLGTNFSGATPPASYGGAAATYQFWADSSAYPSVVLRLNDGVQWVPIGTLNASSHTFSISTSEIPTTISAASYTAADADKGGALSFTNAAAAVSLPQASAGGAFLGGWFVDYRNSGSGTVTITPTISTIDGGSSLVLYPGMAVRIVSDGTNFVTALGLTPASVPRFAGATLTGALLFSADNTNDIGANGATRPRDFYLGRNAAIAGTTALSGALTYGGVTLSNSVTGTGSMVLSASPTFSGTIGGAVTFSGALTLSSALTYGGVTLSNAVTGTGNMVLSASPTLTGTLSAGTGNFSGDITGLDFILSGSSGVLVWTSGSRIVNAADGVITLKNNAATDFGRLQLGGTTSSFPALKRNAAGVEVRLADDSAGSTLTASTVFLNGTNVSVTSTSDGLLQLSNIAGTGFNRINLGGGTSSFPAVKRSGTAIAIRLADDTADAPLTAGAATLSGALTYGGVTLSNAVTGTGNMVLSASPTFSGTIGGAVTFSGALTMSSALTYGGVTLTNAVTGTGSMVLSASPTITGTLATANQTITSASANALAVGPSGTTNPAFNVDASTASSATGINVKSAAAAGGVAISVLSSGTDEALKIDAKGAGTITVGGVSTGAITLTRATTMSAALTYGGVTLSNSVTGTGAMALSASPTFTGTLSAAVGAFSSTLASTAHTITSASAAALTVGLNGATNPALQVDASTASSATGIKIKSAAAAGGVAVSVITSGTNENLTIDAAGSGTITVGGTSTGAITLTRAATLSAALTYGGVTLSNSVTGTGSMVLSSGPTIAGHMTVEGVTATGATGTGKFVFDGSPTLVTPVLGVAAATSINKVAITEPATSATLTIADGKTLTASNSGTLAGGDGFTLAIAAAKTLTVSNTITLAGTDATVMTLPTTSATIARTDAGQTFTGTQTFGTPIALGSGGTGQATAAAARAASGLNIDACTSTGDANYAILAGDRCVYHTALSTARTDTLPAANAFNPGQVIVVNDFRGVASGSNTITLQRAGADTINGGTSAVAVNAQFGWATYMSDGASRWTFQTGSGGGGGSGTVTSVACGVGLGCATITNSGTINIQLHPFLR